MLEREVKRMQILMQQQTPSHMEQLASAYNSVARSAKQDAGRGSGSSGSATRSVGHGAEHYDMDISSPRRSRDERGTASVSCCSICSQQTAELLVCEDREPELVHGGKSYYRWVRAWRKLEE